uniref:BEN domain-containing protein n=1 Tax=Trichogramma kaykai TaxID=54128 RepID=A0ABD2WP70_9HYME
MFIQIPGEKTGEKETREIVKADEVRKFNFEDYQKNKTIVKAKKFKFRRDKIEKSKKCFVLFASKNYDEVFEAQSKRYGIPTLNTSVTDDTDDITEISSHFSSSDESDKKLSDNNITDEEPEVDEITIKKSKAKRKNLKKQKNSNEENAQRNILAAYFTASLNDDENEVLGDLFDSNSSPITSNNNKDCGKVSAIYAKTAESPPNYKELYEEMRAHYEALRKQVKRMREEHEELMESLSSDYSHHSIPRYQQQSMPSCQFNVYKTHDSIYCYDPNAEYNLEYNENGDVHLGSNIYCNKIAFHDSFKSKSAAKCLTTLTQGVYDLKDLASRCVRKQKNTGSKKVLCPIKKFFVEKNVYAFMRMKDKTISDIDDFFDDINRRHHNAITCAQSKLETQRKLREMEKLDTLNGLIA